MKIIYRKELKDFADELANKLKDVISVITPSKPEDIGAYSKNGGDLTGDVTVYAKNNDKSAIQDVKVRKDRIDLFKELTGEKDSSVIFERGKRAELRKFEQIKLIGKKLIFGLNTSGTTDITNWFEFDGGGSNGILATIKSLEHLGINARNFHARFSKIVLSNYSGSDPLDIFSNVPVAANTKDGDDNHAVVMLERDKLQIGTTDTEQHTVEDLLNPEVTSSHPSIGMRIEQSCDKFTLYSKPDGVEIDVKDLANNCWYNTSNGTYKFVPVGSRFASNNKGVKSSTAESTWQGIFKQNTKFTLKYMVSSESGCDKLTATLDGTTIVNAISGDGTEQTYTCRLKAGKHTLTAKYQKDGSVDKYEDRAYLEFANVMVSLDEIQYDTSPTKDSPVPVTSGGVFAAIESLEAGVLIEISDDDIDKIINGTYTE